MIQKILLMDEAFSGFLDPLIRKEMQVWKISRITSNRKKKPLFFNHS